MTPEPKITALQINVETSAFTEENKLQARFKPIEIVAFEAEIPEAVLEWVRQKIGMKGE